MDQEAEEAKGARPKTGRKGKTPEEDASKRYGARRVRIEGAEENGRGGADEDVVSKGGMRLA